MTENYEVNVYREIHIIKKHLQSKTSVMYVFLYSESHFLCKKDKNSAETNLVLTNGSKDEYNRIGFLINYFFFNIFYAPEVCSDNRISLKIAI